MLHRLIHIVMTINVAMEFISSLVASLLTRLLDFLLYLHLDVARHFDVDLRRVVEL